MSLTTDDRVERLKRARQLLAEAGAEVGIPQIETLLRDADTALHWALWNMGVFEDLCPELETANKTPSPSTRNRNLRAAE